MCKSVEDTFCVQPSALPRVSLHVATSYVISLYFISIVLLSVNRHGHSFVIAFCVTYHSDYIAIRIPHQNLMHITVTFYFRTSIR
jgi:hypothetical protein